MCAAQNIGVIPYFPLASGFLSGKYCSEADFGKSKRGGGMTKYMNPRGFRILDAVDLKLLADDVDALTRARAP